MSAAAASASSSTTVPTKTTETIEEVLRCEIERNGPIPYVTFDVGGKCIRTHLQTLFPAKKLYNDVITHLWKQSRSLREREREREGDRDWIMNIANRPIFIDMNPQLFECLLAILRGHVKFDSTTSLDTVLKLLGNFANYNTLFELANRTGFDELSTWLFPPMREEDQQRVRGCMRIITRGFWNLFITIKKNQSSQSTDLLSSSSEEKSAVTTTIPEATDVSWNWVDKYSDFALQSRDRGTLLRIFTPINAFHLGYGAHSPSSPSVGTPITPFVDTIRPNSHTETWLMQFVADFFLRISKLDPVVMLQ